MSTSSSTKRESADETAEAGRKAGELAERAVEFTSERIVDPARRHVATASEWISDNPLKAVGFGAGAGFLIGLVCRHR